MKTICTALLVVLVLPLFSAEYQIHDSINHPTDLYEVSGELVIGVPNFNMKRYDEFLEKINAIPGIRKVDYCSAMEVFLINGIVIQPIIQHLEHQLAVLPIQPLFHKQVPWEHCIIIVL